jgi:xanthine dehydrogenase molybdopterin-binding subunit B
VGAHATQPASAARITAIDTTAAEQMEGVAVVVTADDVPGNATFGLEHPDQPVFASDVIRYQGYYHPNSLLLIGANRI